MSARQAQCPGCGAEIVFESVASLVLVCPSCRYASYRKDLDLERIGKVAELARIESPIELGARGRHQGRSFRVIGLLQLDHGRGPWNEWSIVFEDGSRAWLAEAQGQYLLTKECPGLRAPSFAELRVGEELDLGAQGRWVVAERGSGRLVSMAGELPVDVRPGMRVRYADLSGPGRGFGTLDYGDASEVQAIYLGARYALTDLGFDALATPPPLPRIRAQRVDCPACAGAIELHDANNAKRVGCPYCGALLAAEHALWKVLEKGELFRSAYGPAVGTKATIDGEPYTVLARLERSIRAEGRRWPWDEWLLRREDGEYRWVVCSDRHWSFVEPVALGDVKLNRQTASYQGTTFKHFSGGTARIDRVVGEVYWEVRLGDEARCADYIAPPQMISVEETPDEKVVSLARYMAHEEVQRVFQLPQTLPKSSNVGMIEPNPIRPHLSRFWLSAMALCGLLLLGMVLTSLLRSTGQVLLANYPLEAEGAFVSEEFELNNWRSRAEIALSAPGLEKGYFRAEGQLVHSETQAVHPFHISTAGAPLTTTPEEVGSARVLVGELPRGKYRMKLHTHSTLATPTGQVLVTVKSKGLDPGYGIVVMLGLLAFPLLLSLAALLREGSRWQQSDHA